MPLISIEAAPFTPGVIDAEFLKDEGVDFNSNDIGFIAVPQEQEPMMLG